MKSPLKMFWVLRKPGGGDQLTLVVLRNSIAEKLTELSGSPDAQITQLQQYGMDTGEWTQAVCWGWRS